MTNIIIRQADAADFSALGEVMFRAVREQSSPYTESQREAWMPSARSGDVWDTRLGAQYVLLAEDASGAVGFMSLALMEAANDGYVDFAYILAAARGQGLFHRLYNKIEVKAAAQNHTRLFTHASLMAAPAFAKVGFEYLEKEEVTINGQTLPRFHMSKAIT